MISEFNEWFDADYASTSSRNINQSFAHDELCNDRPIIGAYSYAGYGHAVVICGVNENFGSYAFYGPGSWRLLCWRNIQHVGGLVFCQRK